MRPLPFPSVVINKKFSSFSLDRRSTVWPCYKSCNLRFSLSLQPLRRGREPFRVTNFPRDWGIRSRGAGQWTKSSSTLCARAISQFKTSIQNILKRIANAKILKRISAVAKYNSHRNPIQDDMQMTNRMGIAQIQRRNSVIQNAMYRSVGTQQEIQRRS